MDIIAKALQMKLSAEGLAWVKVSSFRLMAKERRAAIGLLLDDEPDVLELNVHYELEGEEIVIGMVTTSKRWVTEAAQFALEKLGNRHPLPSGIQGKLLRALL